MGNNASNPEPIPSTMKRLVLKSPGTSRDAFGEVELDIETDVPVPVPKAGEVLIRVVATPVNPSDYGVWTRTASSLCPKGIGNEGSGIVVASGGGFSTRGLVGTAVGFIGLKDNQGAYSEYVTVDASKGVFQLPTDMPVEDGASFMVNPYTAYGILDTVRTCKSKAFIHTAAASQLGQMLVKLCKEEGDVALINVVRRQEQAEMLKRLGAEHVVVTGDNPEWKSELKAKAKELGANVAFDAVAGEMSGELINLLPIKKGILYMYGVLSGPASGIDPINLIYHQKQIRGWMLTPWLLAGGITSVLPRIRAVTSRVMGGLKDGWSSTQFVNTSLENMHEEFLSMKTKTGFTNRKLRVVFPPKATEEEKSELAEEAEAKE